jgi:hypothetical protein
LAACGGVLIGLGVSLRGGRCHLRVAGAKAGPPRRAGPAGARAPRLRAPAAPAVLARPGHECDPLPPEKDRRAATPAARGR